MSPRPTILLSFAHPDDESFIAAGIACRYSAAGGRIILVTATLGEEGKRGDPPLATVKELPQLRQAELREAAATIGIESVHLLGYRDRQLEKAAHQEIRRQLVTLIRQFRPDVVITFDPNGTNLHPDHIAISRFTSDALAAAADPRWFHETGRPHVIHRLLWTTPVPPWELVRTGNFSFEAGVDFLIDIHPWVARKIAALRAHRTQHLSIDRIFFSTPNSDCLLRYEMFRQAWGPALNHRPMNDLFDGMQIVV